MGPFLCVEVQVGPPNCGRPHKTCRRNGCDGRTKRPRAQPCLAWLCRLVEGLAVAGEMDQERLQENRMRIDRHPPPHQDKRETTKRSSTRVGPGSCVPRSRSHEALHLCRSRGCRLWRTEAEPSPRQLAPGPSAEQIEPLPQPAILPLATAGSTPHVTIPPDTPFRPLGSGRAAQPAAWL